jgi:hypothetical protein
VKDTKSKPRGPKMRSPITSLSQTFVQCPRFSKKLILKELLGYKAQIIFISQEIKTGFKKHKSTATAGLLLKSI